MSSARPRPLLASAFLDLMVCISFAAILLSNRTPTVIDKDKASQQPTCSFTSTHALLALGFFRSFSLICLCFNRHWAQWGRLCVTTFFVCTGLGVVWDINSSVLSRGTGDMVGTGQTLLNIGPLDDARRAFYGNFQTGRNTIKVTFLALVSRRLIPLTKENPKADVPNMR